MPGVAVFALPPNFAPAAGEDMVGGEGRIFGWVPFGGYARIFCGEIVEAREHLGVGAVRAAAASLGAAGDGGLILVAFIADPPDFFVAGGSDLLWGEGAILGWVPLGCNGWILAGEVVLAGEDHFAGADWATAAIDASGDGCAPFMAFITNPPDFAPGAGDDIARREVAIFGWVPLAGELGIVGGEVVFSAQECAVAANRAAGAGHSAFDLGTPHVSMLTLPPDETVAAGEHVGRGEIAVFGGMPLAGDIWIAGGEVGLAGNGPTAVAIRAACAAAASGMDGGLPTVSIRTAPPNVPFAAIAYAFWGERQVALAVPLVKQFFAACAATEIGERFAHIDHLLQIKKQRDPQL